MTVWTLTLANHDAVVRAIAEASSGSRVTLDDGPLRTGPQNRLMWRLLNCFADQMPQGHDPETWKCVLLKAFGKELEFVPSLDGKSVVALGYRSSLLTKEEMSNFIEFVFSEGLQRGVVFDADLSEPMKALPA